jgi:ribosomal protein L7/L12
MDYIYNTHVAVPEHTIRKICNDLINNTMHECLGIDINMNGDQLRMLREKMDAIRNSICADNHVSCDGWELNSEQILEVFTELKGYKKIGAIKAFRSATGCGLREGKEFIDGFCTGARNESGPMAAMNFKIAFNE